MRKSPLSIIDIRNTLELNQKPECNESTKRL